MASNSTKHNSSDTDYPNTKKIIVIFYKSLKFINMKILTILLLFIIINFSYMAYGQELLVSIKGSSYNPCPNDQVTYYIDISNGPTGKYTCTAWNVENGDIVAGGKVNDQNCTIKWHDETAGKITIAKVLCEKADKGGILSRENLKKDVNINSLKDVNPVNLTGSLSVNIKENTSLLYSVDPIKYGTNNEVSQYYWNIPPNWTCNGVISNGVNTFTTDINSISVVPDDCTEGTIKVWSENTICQGFSPSGSISININRIWPRYPILGPKKICTSATYSINLPKYASINWSSSSNIKLTSAKGSNPATFSKIGTSGKGWIKATLSVNQCTGVTSIENKNIWVGIPTPEYIDYINVGPYFPNSDEICLDNGNDGKVTYTDNNAEITDFEWDANDWTVIQHPNVLFPDINMQDVLITAPPYGYSVGDPVYITVRAKNSCSSGWSDWKYPKLQLNAVNCGSFMMVIAPNPADTYVELSFIDIETTFDKNINQDTTNYTKVKKDKTEKNGGLENSLIQILDSKGTIRKTSQVNDKKVRIETQDLAPGTYYIHLLMKDKIYKQQLLIK